MLSFGNCNNKPNYAGMNDCYIRNWLQQRVIGPLNCTLFYLQHKHTNVPICKHGTIIQNYKNFQNLSSASKSVSVTTIIWKYSFSVCRLAKE